MKLETVTRTPVALTGTTASSSTAVTGLPSTATLAPGMAVSGTGIAADTTIAAIVSTTAITLSAAATASGTVSLTFALVEPVTLAQAKAHLRVTFNDDDALIAPLISTARADCERATARTLVTRTYDLTLDRLPHWGYGHGFQHGASLMPRGWDAIDLPAPPLVSIQWVKYYDLAGTLQTIDPSLYIVSAGTPGRIAPTYLQYWPQSQYRIDSVQIRYTAGYTPSDVVPDFYKTAMKLLVYHYYNHREAVIESFGTLHELPLGVQAVLASGDWGSYH